MNVLTGEKCWTGEITQIKCDDKRLYKTSTKQHTKPKQLSTAQYGFAR